jgi:hypothetical protein
MVRRWEYTFFYVYFLFCCLFASNGAWGLFFGRHLLCCSVCVGCIYGAVDALMEENQRIEDENKERVVGWAAMGFQQVFNEREISFQEAYIDNVLARVRGSKRDFCC